MHLFTTLKTCQTLGVIHWYSIIATFCRVAVEEPYLRTLCSNSFSNARMAAVLTQLDLCLPPSIPIYKSPYNSEKEYSFCIDKFQNLKSAAAPE